MLGSFNGNLIKALAAYNGGPGNVRKWSKRWNNLSLLEWVESIPFRETRNYVKRIMEFYVHYVRLYNDSDYFEKLFNQK
jgi:soluble lytic murein transglycosylase